LNCGFSATLKPIPNDCQAISGRAESPDGSPQTTNLTAGLMVYAGAHDVGFSAHPKPVLVSRIARTRCSDLTARVMILAASSLVGSRCAM